MTWTLNLYRLDTGERYAGKHECPSAEACKRWAKDWHRSVLRGHGPPDLLAQISDPTGRPAFYAEIRRFGSWRVTWHFGSRPARLASMQELKARASEVQG